MPPEAVAECLANREGFVFLDSALESGGAISILGIEPDRIVEGDIADAAILRRELAAGATQTADAGFPTGGAIGAIDFDGRFRFGIYRSLLVYARSTETWWAVGPNANDIAESIGNPCDHEVVPLDFQQTLSQDAFCAMVHRAQDYIAAGDIYQVCLAHRFETPFDGDAWPFHAALRHYSPAPYSAFLSLGNRTVVSASPECFLRMSGRHIETRPIKGTRPRRSGPDADERSAYDLITSPKEIAELVMITDLERNDLGRVCEFGSVHVADLLRLERYEQVFHLVSTVRGTLRDDVSHVDALAACFPGGSISGAPKKRALEIISELEPEPRGLYTGAIGYFGFNGESQFNIAIRTVVIENGTASFHVGAGIVADSLPEKEWQETLDKAAGIRLAAERMTLTPPRRQMPREIARD